LKAGKSGKGRSQKRRPAAYATPALEKGLDILELLAHERDGLTKSEIARSLNRTVSEIFRMLVCLERRDYISETAADRYVLSLRLFQLVQEHPPTERLFSEALPRMHLLVEKIQQSCHLGVLDSARIVILAQASGSGSIGFYVKAGSNVDLIESATGQVILAYLPKETLQRTLKEWEMNPVIRFHRTCRGIWNASAGAVLKSAQAIKSAASSISRPPSATRRGTLTPR